MIHNKLVRDKIPEVLSKKGIAYHMKVIKQNEFKKMLLLKLHEELQELKTELQARLVEKEKVIAEIADCLEVIEVMYIHKSKAVKTIEKTRRTISQAMKLLAITEAEVMVCKDRKRLERGSFRSGFYLFRTEDDN